MAFYVPFLYWNEFQSVLTFFFDQDGRVDAMTMGDSLNPYLEPVEHFYNAQRQDGHGVLFVRRGGFIGDGLYQRIPPRLDLTLLGILAALRLGKVPPAGGDHV